MIPAPIPPDDDLRLRSLRALNLLDTPPEERYDRLTQLARELFDVPIALVSLVDRNRQWFKSKQGIQASETPRDISFCGHTIASDRPLIIPDASVDPRFFDNPLVAEDPSIRFYAGAPLSAPDGQKIGTLCLIDSKPRELTSKQVQLLVKLAQLVEEEITDGSVLRGGRAEAESALFLSELKGSTRGIRRRAAGAFLAAAVLLISFTAFAFNVMRELGGDIDDVAAARESISAVSDTMVAVQSVETGARGYALTGQKRFLESYSAGTTYLRNALGTLRRISADEETLSLELNKARVYAERSGDISERIVKARRSHGLQVAVAEVGKTSNFTSMDSLRHLSRALDTAITTRMQERTERLTHRAIKLGSTLAASCLLAVFLLGWSLLEVDRNSEARILAQAEAARAASALQAVFDSATAVAIIATDPDGLIKVFNRGAEKMLGHSALEMVGRNTPVRIHVPAEIEARGVELTRSLGKEIRGFAVFVEPASHGSSDEREWTYVRKDGTRFPVELIITAIRDGRKDIVGYLQFATDITAQKQVREEMARARDLAVKAADMKSQFMANMSHEIRTPLNAIIGMSGLMMETQMSELQHDYLTTVRQAGDALLAVINDILDFSKIEAGKLILEELDFDPRETLDEVIGLIGASAEAKKLKVTTLVEPSVPAAVRGDPGRVRQVLLNLLSNAVKFTEAGGVRVQVSWSESMMSFRVIDTGIGIPAEKVSGLFSAFSQADSSMTRRFGGTGLGLAICRRLAELMGGKVSVKSAHHKGSEFTFEVPLASLRTAPTSTPLSGVAVLVRCSDKETSSMVASVVAWAGGQDLPAGRMAECLALVSDLPEEEVVALASRLKPGAAIVRITQRDALTVFRKVLRPLRRSALIAALTARPGAETGASPEKPRRTLAGNRRILLVEDNAVNQRVALSMLRGFGCEANAVGNGLEALEALSTIPYDIVLMDCSMPEMNGFEATRAWRARERPGHRIPIIAMTANALEGDRQLCLDAGMDEYLSKPVKQEELLNMLERFGPATDPAKVNELLELAKDGDATLLEDAREYFRRDLDTTMSGIRAAVSSGDAALLSRLAHRLIGASSTIGIVCLEHDCRTLKKMADSGDLSKAAEAVVALEVQAIRACDALALFQLNG